MLAGLPLAASSIDLNGQTTVWVDTGGALVFTLASYGFGAQAAANALSPYPTAVSFSFVSAFPGPRGPFDALLEAPGGSGIATYPELLEFVPGQYQGAYYAGQVGVLEGSWALTPALSQKLFSGRSAVLVLRNLGPAAGLGLSSYTIAHDLTVSVFGGGLSTGAPVVQAMVEDPAPADAPEQGSGWLLAGGAVLCWAAAHRAKRVSGGEDRG